MIIQKLFEKATSAISEIHSCDPSFSLYNGENIPSERLYSERMLMVLNEFEPDSDYILQLAIQCQHFERWKVARDLFSMDRKGYHQWRNAVMDYQLSRTTEVLKNAGIDNADIAEITDTLSKQGNKSYEKAQIVQDVACIVFVKWYLEPFAAKHEIEKVKDIIAKTTRKISQKGLQALQQTTISEAVQILLQ